MFVHGCFWHGHSCKLGRLPKTRTEFWEAKIAANRERDHRKADQLVQLGWRVMTVWQCSLKRPDELMSEMDRFLRGDRTCVETEAVEVGKGD
jgi:DNA mismatch endonuclease (patch repair protein)